MKKIEIVARIFCDGVNTGEKTLMEWTDGEGKTDSKLVCSVLYYPGLEIRLSQRRVLKDGKEVHLSRYEYGVLSFMAQHPGTLFTKEEIFENVWAEDSESCLSAVTNTINRIRQKVEDHKETPVYIQTVSNLGYVFAMDKDFRRKIAK